MLRLDPYFSGDSVESHEARQAGKPLGWVVWFPNIVPENGVREFATEMNLAVFQTHTCPCNMTQYTIRNLNASSCVRIFFLIRQG
jgi:hypothetical protein